MSSIAGSIWFFIQGIRICLQKELQNSKKQVELQQVSFNKFKETFLSPSQFEHKKNVKKNLKLKSDRFNNRETKKSSMD